MNHRKLNQSADAALLVCSCDKTVDVAKYFAASYKRYWKALAFPIFVGCGEDQSVAGLVSGKAVRGHVGAKGWKAETASQLDEIKRTYPDIKYILLFLDDFVLGDVVEEQTIRYALEKSSEFDLPYLRLTRIEGSIWKRWRRHPRCDTLIEIPDDHPYYSSLQVAIWEINHLSATIDKCADIWDFERQRDERARHYSVSRSLLTYRHIVEKGFWNVHAVPWCTKKLSIQFNSGGRPFHPENSRIKNLLRRLLFMVIGYSVMRARTRRSNKRENA